MKLAILFLGLVTLSLFGFGQTAEEYFQKGLALAVQNKYKAAIKDYDKAIEINSGIERWFFERGNAKFDGLKDYKGAIADYSRAIELDHRYLFAYYNRASAKDELGDVEGTIKDCNKVIEIDPADVDAYTLRGVAKRKLKDYDGEVEDLYYPPIPKTDTVSADDIELSLGMKLQGGYVFYLDDTGKHGLIAAENDAPQRMSWGCNRFPIGANNLTDGMPNTKLILKSCQYPSAASVCAELHVQDYNDWYLPSIDELALLYDGRRYVPTIGGGDYMSSTEYFKNGNDCWAIHFAKGGERYRYNKRFKYSVRAIRKF